MIVCAGQSMIDCVITESAEDCKAAGNPKSMVTCGTQGDRCRKPTGEHCKSVEKNSKPPRKTQYLVAGKIAADKLQPTVHEVAEEISLAPGGEAFNEAMAFAALGDQVVLSSAIGSDTAGMLLRRTAEEAGILVHTGAYRGRTPVSLLSVDADGGRKSRISKIHALEGYVPTLPEFEGQWSPRHAQDASDVSACTAGTARHTPADAGSTLRDASGGSVSHSDIRTPVTDKDSAAPPHIDFVTMGSLFRPPFLDPAACLTFAKSAKATGAKLLADTKLPKGTTPRLADYAETLALLDFITPNEQEAAYYTGCADPERAAAVFHSYGIPTVIIKLAERGCYVSTLMNSNTWCGNSHAGASSCPQPTYAGGRGTPAWELSAPDGINQLVLGNPYDFYLPAFPVTVADGIGAGDTFNAGLIHSLLRGASLYEAAVFASACAAICVTGRGATAALHSEAQVQEFLHIHAQS